MISVNRIMEKQTLAPGIASLEVSAPDIARKARAGQFVMVRVSPEGERIPLTIADFNPERGSLTLVVQEAGFTTSQLVGMNEGDILPDVAGPLGKPSDIEKAGHAACVGGGVGIAPLYPVARAFKEAGCRVTAVLCARAGDLIFWEDRFREFADEVLVFTDDGSRGHKGRAPEAIDLISTGGKPDLVFAVGPVVMMKFVSLKTLSLGIRTMVSLNPVMVDGTGMCGGCRVSVGGRAFFACVDGPEFDGHLVDFDELIARQGFYEEEEGKVHKCKLEQQAEKLSSDSHDPH